MHKHRRGRQERADQQPGAGNSGVYPPVRHPSAFVFVPVECDLSECRRSVCAVLHACPLHWVGWTEASGVGHREAESRQAGNTKGLAGNDHHIGPPQGGGRQVAACIRHEGGHVWHRCWQARRHRATATAQRAKQTRKGNREARGHGTQRVRSKTEEAGSLLCRHLPAFVCESGQACTSVAGFMICAPVVCRQTYVLGTLCNEYAIAHYAAVSPVVSSFTR
jgi:hypothetical protein